MTAPSPQAVPPSDNPDPVTWGAIGRSLIGAACAGLFLSFVRAFNTGHMAFLPRTAFMVSLALVGTLFGVFAFRLACRIPGLDGRRMVQGAIAGVILSPVMTLVAWSADWLVPGGGVPLDQISGYFLNTLVLCVVLTLGAVSLNKRAYLAKLVAQVQADARDQARAELSRPVKFLERLPSKLRGAEIWAVEAEDHYLRLHTSLGQDLILLRLADAIDELDGLEGAQVHRSWWVSRAAIAEARRGDGRATLTLQDGSEVPVSRTYAKLLRERGWI